MTIEFDGIESNADQPGGSRRRVAGVIAATMLVAAAGGVGFGIGRSVDRAEETVVPSESATEPDTVPSATEPVTEGSDLPADTAQNESDGESSDAVGSVTVASSGGPGFTVFGDQTTELLYDRTTDGGLTVRVHLGQVWEGELYGTDDFGDVAGNGWQPPGWCFESGRVRVALGGSDLIDVGSAPWYTEPYQGRSVSWLTLGRPDEAPHRVVFAQVPEGTTGATVSFGDGATDTAAPQNGVVALVVAGAPETIEHDDDGFTWFEEIPDFDLTIESPSGAVAITSDAAGTWDDPEFAASCSPPPPALPDPGDQPVDAAADEQTITELMANIYGDADDESFEVLDWVDDPTGVAEAREQVAEGSFEESAASAEAIVEELVFTSPDEAWFRYRIETSITTLRERFGIAHRIGGVWKISRDTICQDLSMASGTCVPEFEVVRPPLD